MAQPLHIIKLSVGTEDVADLAAWQQDPRWQTPEGYPRHVTRMWPKREGEILGGGSLYWVIKGVVQCRQRIIRFDEVTGGDGIKRCAFVLDPEIVRVANVPRKAFQGWRYFQAGDAPPDLAKARKGEDTLPPALQLALAEIGVL